MGILVDEAGDDVYRCKDFGIGAGAFGIGVFLDKAGNDLYHADRYGQGFASTWGCGVLADLAGNDSYDAGGVHLHAPLYRDRYQSLSQGFSIGMRPDASGGVGVLVDVAGNDRYATDIYGQGSSYWYSLGLLIDDDGNDTYLCGQYGQGAGIHLSAGMLLDRAGHDLYHCANGVGVGGAHDYAVGLLVDRGGDDHYSGSGGSQGGALTNSVAILLDGGGNDGYTAVRDGSQGFASTARNTGGIGLLLDAGGKDVYSSRDRDGKAWTREWVGGGLDEPGAADEAASDPGTVSISEEAARAEVDREGTVPLNDGRRVDDLDRLWKIACRWEVGDNRVIVPIARARLVALGAPALDRALERIGTKDGLEVRAVEATLAAFPADQVLPRLLERSRDPDAKIRKGAVRGMGSIRAAEALDRLIELLDDGEIRTTVLEVLSVLKRAPTQVPRFLRSAKESEGVAAAACLAAVADAESIELLVEALHPDFSFPVRIAAEQRLAGLGDAAVPALARATAQGGPMRQRRAAIRALCATKSEEALPALLAALRDGDPAIRREVHVGGGILVALLGESPAIRAFGEVLTESALREEDPLVRRFLAK